MRSRGTGSRYLRDLFELFNRVFMASFYPNNCPASRSLPHLAASLPHLEAFIAPPRRPLCPTSFPLCPTSFDPLPHLVFSCLTWGKEATTLIERFGDMRRSGRLHRAALRRVYERSGAERSGAHTPPFVFIPGTRFFATRPGPDQQRRPPVAVVSGRGAAGSANRDWAGAGSRWPGGVARDVDSDH